MTGSDVTGSDVTGSAAEASQRSEVTDDFRRTADVEVGSC